MEGGDDRLPALVVPCDPARPRLSVSAGRRRVKVHTGAEILAGTRQHGYPELSCVIEALESVAHQSG
jgi:hypothetical protein